MKFLEKLTNLVKSKIDGSFNNSKFSLISYEKTTIVNGKQDKAVEYDQDKRLVTIDLNHLSEDERKVVEGASKEYVEEGNYLLEESSSDLLEELYKFNKQPNSTLNFFRDIISPSDFLALKSSIFVAKKFKNGGNVSGLKEDIIRRFGDRGKNISNLCTAGYFEEFIIPLYNSDKKKFPRIYEELVSSSMFAIFVNSSMSPKDIRSQITRKIKISRKYGFRFIHVHGIGNKNIATIMKFIEKNKKDGLIELEKIRYHHPEAHILIVELILS